MAEGGPSDHKRRQRVIDMEEIKRTFEEIQRLKEETKRAFEETKRALEEREERVQVHRGNDSNESILWDKCIRQRNVQEAISLLRERKMPPKGMLMDIFHAFPENRKLVFEQISYEITCSNRNVIKDTVSFYTHHGSNEMKIVFIYEPKEADKIPDIDFHGYNIEHREIYQMSDENDEVNGEEAKIKQIDFEQVEQVEQCIREHQVKLMETHTNLMMISPSSVKSSGFNSDGQRLLKTKECIVFYVQYKGYIPIDEDALPSCLNNIPTDVREGCASLQHYSPHDYIERVIIGSAISKNAGSMGTLGCFLEKDGEVFALTSLHNMMEIKYYDDLLKMGGRQDEFSHGTHCPVTKLTSSGECDCEHSCYQPKKNAKRSNNTRLGFLTSAVYQRGGQFSSGFEIAIIKLRTDRIPSSGKFPFVKWDYISTESKGLEYTSGKFIDVKMLQPGDKVFKVGASSLLTKGTLINKTTTVRLEFGILFNCMKISWNFSTFSKPGDSGAMVFAYGDSTTNETLQSVGIVTGSCPQKYPSATIVTPISEIMRVIGTNYTIKSFKSHTHDNAKQQEQEETKQEEQEKVSNTGGLRGLFNRRSCIIL